MNYKEFIKKIEDGSFPRDQWNHLNHLRLGLFYLVDSKNLYEAINKLKCSLIRYNQLSEEKNNCYLKYSETATCFWMFQIDKFLVGRNHLDLEVLDVQLSESDLSKSSFLYKFYSKDILNTEKAKALYLLPDKIDM